MKKPYCLLEFPRFFWHLWHLWKMGSYPFIHNQFDGEGTTEVGKKRSFREWAKLLGNLKGFWNFFARKKYMPPGSEWLKRPHPSGSTEKKVRKFYNTLFRRFSIKIRETLFRLHVVFLNGKRSWHPVPCRRPLCKTWGKGVYPHKYWANPYSLTGDQKEEFRI